MNIEIVLRSGIVALLLILSFVSAFGQTPGPITAPLLNILDFDGDTATQPLLMVVGGNGSSTLGIEVTSQSASSTGSGTPPWSTIQPTGFGGLSLVQTGAATSGGGQNSPSFAQCAQQLTGSGSSAQCWYWQVLGGAGAANSPDTLRLFRTSANSSHNITLQVPAALNFAAGDNANGGQLTIGSVPSSASNLSTAPVTVVGGFTNNTGGIAATFNFFPACSTPQAP